MGEITALKAQKSRSFVNIYIDEKYYCSLSLTEVLKRSLKKGQQIDPKELTLLKGQSLYDYLYSAVQNFLSYRPRSEKEVRDYLKKKAQKKDPGTKDHDNLYKLLIDKLKEVGLLDDLAFARWFVSQRVEHRPKGPAALTSELFSKGVPRDITTQVVNEVVGDPQKAVLLAKSALSKKRTWQNLAPEEYKKKAYGFLARRGFSYDIIRRVVDRDGDWG